MFSTRGSSIFNTHLQLSVTLPDRLFRLSFSCMHLGGVPYPKIQNRAIADLLRQGYRMPKPKHVDDAL